MQRFKQPNMDLHPDGEWIRYSDHVEAMKRIVGAPVTQGLTNAQARQIADMCGCSTGMVFAVIESARDLAAALPAALTFEMWFDETSGFTKHDEAVARAAWNAAKNATLTKRTMSFAEATDLWNRITNYSDSAATHFITRFANALLAASPADQVKRDDYERAYRHGWINCAKWADRIDLVADVDSPAYNKDRDEAMKLAMSATPPASED